MSTYWSANSLTGERYMQGRPKGVYLPLQICFAEQNRTTDEHRFSCVGDCALGKSKCRTVWSVASRNGIPDFSCCAVLEVGERNEERMQ